MSTPIGMISNIFEINLMLSRIVGQKATLWVGMTAGAQEDTISIDTFEIRNTRDEAITTKMANTLIHNIACALEDSRHHGKHFKVVRHQNDFRVVCNGIRGMNIFSSVMKTEVKKMEDTIRRCRTDIKKMADEFGVETVQHVLNNKRMESV